MNDSMFQLVISRWRNAFEGLKETNDYKFLSASSSLMKNMVIHTSFYHLYFLMLSLPSIFAVELDNVDVTCKLRYIDRCFFYLLCPKI